MYRQTRQYHTTKLFHGQGLLSTPRVGRPRAKLSKPSSEITVRVRRLLDLAHDGNVREASIASEIPYATLRDLYTGKGTNPSLRTLQALANAYGIYPGWFTDPSQPEDVPIGGYVVHVPAFPGDPLSNRRREIVIPYAAFPLPKIYLDFADALEALPATKYRPIVGDAHPDRLGDRLAEFLLCPLLEEEKQLGERVILESQAWAAVPDWLDPAARERYVRRLRLLGKFWENEREFILSRLRVAATP